MQGLRGQRFAAPKLKSIGNRLSFYPLKHTRMTKLRITVKFLVGMLMRVRGLTPRTRTFTRINVPVIS